MGPPDDAVEAPPSSPVPDDVPCPPELPEPFAPATPEPPAEAAVGLAGEPPEQALSERSADVNTAAALIAERLYGLRRTASEHLTCGADFTDVGMGGFTSRLRQSKRSSVLLPACSGAPFDRERKKEAFLGNF